MFTNLVVRKELHYYRCPTRRHNGTEACEGKTRPADKDPAARNRYLVIGGPKPLTWLDVVATYERVLGRPIPVQVVAAGQPVPGLPDPMPAS